MKNLFKLILLLLFTMQVYAQDTEIVPNPANAGVSTFNCDLSGQTTISPEYAEWLKVNCKDTITTERTEEGITTYKDITLLFEDDKVIEKIVETSTTTGGNLGDEFPANISLPIQGNKTNIVSIDNINTSNYSTVLKPKILQLINDYKTFLELGFFPEKEITIKSTADRDAPTLNIPTGGYNIDQVKASYSIGGNITIPTNEKLAKNRGENIKSLILNIAAEKLGDEDKKNLSDLIKVEDKINQPNRIVDISAVKFIKITKSDGNVYDIKKNEIVEDDGNQEVVIEEVIVDPKKKTDPPKKKKTFLKKLLIGLGIAAVVGGAAYGISRIGKGKRNNNSTQPGINPTNTNVDPSIDGWKYLTSSKRCIPYKFNPNLLDSKIYFRTEGECKPPASNTTSNTNTTTTSSSNNSIPKPKPKPKPVRNEIKPTSVTANDYQDDVDYSELPEQQILNLANTGKVHTTDLGYCSKSSYKLLQPCPMTKHPNQYIRRQQGITKYFGKVTIVCQKIENKAKYTVVLEKDCTE